MPATVLLVYRMVKKTNCNNQACIARKTGGGGGGRRRKRTFTQNVFPAPRGGGGNRETETNNDVPKGRKNGGGGTKMFYTEPFSSTQRERENRETDRHTGRERERKRLVVYAVSRKAENDSKKVAAPSGGVRRATGGGRVYEWFLD